MDTITRRLVKEATKINDDSKQDNLEPTTVEHLIALLVSSDKIISDKSFIFSFFLSSRVFISSHELLKLIFEKTIHFISNYDKLTQEILSESLSRFMVVLGEWAKHFPHDFRVSSMIETYGKIRKKCLMLDNYFIDDFNSITAYLTKKHENLTNYESYLKSLHHERLVKSKDKISENSILKVCGYDPKLLALQLTHIEYDRLSHIGAEEFIHYFLSRGKFDTAPSSQLIDFKYARKFDSANFKNYLNELKRFSEKEEIFMENASNKIQHYIKTSSNLEAYILWFNRLSNFVACEIMKCLKRDDRVVLVEFFIDVAYSCFELGNFNSVMAIIAALNLLHVTRLKKTWQKVNTTKLKLLSSSTDSSNNYFIYRRILEGRFEKIKNTDAIIIPIFTLVMRDLNHLFYNLPSKNFKGYWNIERFWEMAKYISKNAIGKSKSLEYVQLNQVINYLLTEPILTVEAAAYASFRLEEPEGLNEIKYFNELNGVSMNQSSHFLKFLD